MGKPIGVALSFALLSAAGLPSRAAGAECEESRPGLPKEAKVTCAEALKTALGKVPQGKLKSSELEVEHGKLVWSFDLVTEGKDGVDEVQVDAKSGKVVSVEHETKAQEAAEAKAEGKANRSAAQPKADH